MISSNLGAVIINATQFDCNLTLAFILKLNWSVFHYEDRHVRVETLKWNKFNIASFLWPPSQHRLFVNVVCHHSVLPPHPHLFPARFQLVLISFEAAAPQPTRSGAVVHQSLTPAAASQSTATIQGLMELGTHVSLICMFPRCNLWFSSACFHFQSSRLPFKFSWVSSCVFIIIV